MNGIDLNKHAECVPAMEIADRNFFVNKSIESKNLYFASLGFFLSMQFRGAYSPGSNHDDGPLRTVNESAHRIFQCLRALASGGRNGVPEEIVLNMIRDISREGGFEAAFESAESEARNAVVDKLHKI
ncbi:hypothetical protein [Ralstonia solanacearum]|uniref:hypothetical protein n=1 Tax=Ralstonia solanacearum TaxID=305 RepID=UPI000A4FD44F|nr:hypothetical protein [Ralstonia solanacearum]